jgi:hypothetical protein
VESDIDCAFVRLSHCVRVCVCALFSLRVYIYSCLSIFIYFSLTCFYACGVSLSLSPLFVPLLVCACVCVSVCLCSCCLVLPCQGELASLPYPCYQRSSSLTLISEILLSAVATCLHQQVRVLSGVPPHSSRSPTDMWVQAAASNDRLLRRWRTPRAPAQRSRTPPSRSGLRALQRRSVHHRSGSPRSRVRRRHLFLPLEFSRIALRSRR